MYFIVLSKVNVSLQVKLTENGGCIEFFNWLGADLKIVKTYIFFLIASCFGVGVGGRGGCLN